MPFGERFKGCFCLGFYMYPRRGSVWNCSITWRHCRQECSGVFSPSSFYMKVPVSVLTAADSKVSFVLKSLLSKRVPPDKHRKDLKDGKLNFPRIEKRSVLFWAMWCKKLSVVACTCNLSMRRGCGWRQVYFWKPLASQSRKISELQVPWKTLPHTIRLRNTRCWISQTLCMVYTPAYTCPHVNTYT